MILPLIISALAALSVALIFVGIARIRQPDQVQNRLARYAVPARNLEELELRQPFSDRMVKPLMQQMSWLILSRTPPKTVAAIQHKLILAGNPYNIDVRDFLGIKGFVGLILGAVCFLLLVRVGSFLNAVAFSAILAVLGYYIPNYWLSSRISARKKEISRALPDALDLLTVCVEAGLGFDAALAKVAQKWENALSYEFGRILSEIRMGKTRREALRALVSRTEVPEVSTFVSAIIQADQLGVSIGKVLHIQSDQMRIRRRQRAEELAHQAPLKMVFPMVILIFPSIYVVVLGPALPTIVNSLGAR
ncbi:MAG: type II secretion system F family protein [Chloroflexi bacterium]|nr:type II secretion system F family protein [Chloroflexota bacterium]